MKTNFLKLYSFLLIFTAFSISAQVNTNSNTVPALADSNFFLDATNFEGLANGSFGRGLGFPRTNLTTFEFNTQVIDDIQILSDFDGMVVFNSATGSTLSGQGVVTAVAPGFYYFSNPGNPGNITSGRWLPLGGQSATVKSKEVTVVVPANPTTATLDLGTSVIAANEVTSFLGAKIYDSTGENLVMTADSAYNKSTNLLTTGNGIMYQVLPEGTYKVVVDYK